MAKSAFSRDYYLLPGETDEERLRLERQFALLEDQVAPLMKWLARRPLGPVQIDDQDRDALAGYTAILHIRVPAYTDAALARAQSMARDPEMLGLADATEFRDDARSHCHACPDSPVTDQVSPMSWTQTLARPEGAGRALATCRIPIEGRDEWIAAAGHLA